MVGVLVVAVARFVSSPPHTVATDPTPTKIGFAVAVGLVFLFGAGIILAIAWRRRWAFIVYAVSTVLGLPAAVVHLSHGSMDSAGNLAYLLLLVAGILPIGLLLTPSARAFFAQTPQA
jgi:hypothetical protein